MTGSIYSVSQVNSYIRNLFTQDFLLRRLTVCGEISNCKYHSSGHIYFTLKDAGGVINGVMFKGSRRGLSFQLCEGDRVNVTGNIGVYERNGAYQIYADKIEREGAGLLYQKFLELKERLEEMGMFAEEYKQPIPKFASRIGIVTSPTGAAIHDIQTISHRRNPYVQLILCPTLVQGEGAAESIVHGIETLEQRNVDVIIVGRGGGSLEDLWAFNEEIVARAIFECTVPIISAVGHETDFTIADFAADCRAATPSAAAELAVYEADRMLNDLEGQRQAMIRSMRRTLDQTKGRANQYLLRLSSLHPKAQLQQNQQRAVDLEEKFNRTLEGLLTKRRHQLELYAARLESASPLKKLQGSYAYLTNSDGRSVPSAEVLSSGDEIRAHLIDGVVTARVEKVELLKKNNAQEITD